MLGTGGKSAGAYGVRLLYSAYTGPVMRIRNNAATPTFADFYADAYGNLGTGANGTGTTLSAWLTANSATIAYVHTWYDQTGNGNHATQTTTTLQPVYDTTNKYVNFLNTASTVGNTSAYMSLPDSAYPYGNSAYSFIFKHGALRSNPGGNGFGAGNALFFGGTATSNTAQNVIGYISTNNYVSVWQQDDRATTTNAFGTTGDVISETYPGTVSNARVIYRNGTSQSLSGGGSGVRSQPNTNNYLGYDPVGGITGYYWSSPLYYFYWAPISLSNADRNVLEATPFA